MVALIKPAPDIECARSYRQILRYHNALILQNSLDFIHLAHGSVF